MAGTAVKVVQYARSACCGDDQVQVQDPMAGAFVQAPSPLVGERAVLHVDSSDSGNNDNDTKSKSCSGSGNSNGTVEV